MCTGTVALREIVSGVEKSKARKYLSISLKLYGGDSETISMLHPSRQITLFGLGSPLWIKYANLSAG